MNYRRGSYLVIFLTLIFSVIFITPSNANAASWFSNIFPSQQTTQSGSKLLQRVFGFLGLRSTADSQNGQVGINLTVSRANNSDTLNWSDTSGIGLYNYRIYRNNEYFKNDDNPALTETISSDSSQSCYYILGDNGSGGSNRKSNTVCVGGNPGGGNPGGGNPGGGNPGGGNPGNPPVEPPPVPAHILILDNTPVAGSRFNTGSEVTIGATAFGSTSGWVGSMKLSLTKPNNQTIVVECAQDIVAWCYPTNPSTQYKQWRVSLNSPGAYKFKATAYPVDGGAPVSTEQRTLTVTGTEITPPVNPGQAAIRYISPSPSNNQKFSENTKVTITLQIDRPADYPTPIIDLAWGKSDSNTMFNYRCDGSTRALPSGWSCSRNGNNYTWQVVGTTGSWSFIGFYNSQNGGLKQTEKRTIHFGTPTVPTNPGTEPEPQPSTVVQFTDPTSSGFKLDNKITLKSLVKSDPDKLIHHVEYTYQHQYVQPGDSHHIIGSSRSITTDPTFAVEWDTSKVATGEKPLSPGDYLVIARFVDVNNTIIASKSKTITLSDNGKHGPLIKSFTADKTEVGRGQKPLINWEVGDVDSFLISPSLLPFCGNPLPNKSSCYADQPLISNTTFVIQARWGSVTETKTIEVKIASGITKFTYLGGNDDGRTSTIKNPSQQFMVTWLINDVKLPPDGKVKISSSADIFVKTKGDVFKTYVQGLPYTVTEYNKLKNGKIILQLKDVVASGKYTLKLEVLDKNNQSFGDSNEWTKTLQLEVKNTPKGYITLQGSIKEDVTNALLPEASIKLDYGTDSPAYLPLAKDGMYRANEVDKNLNGYSVIVSAPDHKTIYQKIPDSSGQQITTDFRLEKSVDSACSFEIAVNDDTAPNTKIEDSNVVYTTSTIEVLLKSNKTGQTSKISIPYKNNPLTINCRDYNMHIGDILTIPEQGLSHAENKVGTFDIFDFEPDLITKPFTHTIVDRKNTAYSIPKLQTREQKQLAYFHLRFVDKNNKPLTVGGAISSIELINSQGDILPINSFGNIKRLIGRLQPDTYKIRATGSFGTRVVGSIRLVGGYNTLQPIKIDFSQKATINLAIQSSSVNPSVKVSLYDGKTGKLLAPSQAIENINSVDVGADMAVNFKIPEIDSITMKATYNGVTETIDNLLSKATYTDLIDNEKHYTYKLEFDDINDICVKKVKLSNTTICALGAKGKRFIENSQNGSVLNNMAGEANRLRQLTGFAHLGEYIYLSDSPDYNAISIPDDPLNNYNIVIMMGYLEDSAERSVIDTTVRHELGHQFKSQVEENGAPDNNGSKNKQLRANLKQLSTLFDQTTEKASYIFAKEVDELYNGVSGGHPWDNDHEDFASTIFHDNSSSNKYCQKFTSEINNLPVNSIGRSLMQQKKNIADKIFNRGSC